MSIQWPLVFFTLFMCASAGVMGGTGIMVALGKARKLYYPAIVITVVLMVLGGASSFLHLKHWDRIFNGFGNITSGITLELIAIVLAIVVLIVFFALVRRTEEEKPVAKWIGWVMLVVSLALAVVCALSYLMAARPAWSNAGEVLYFITNTILLGSAIIWMVAVIKKSWIARTFGLVVCITGAVVAIVTVVFAVLALNATFSVPMSYYDPVTPTVHLAAGATAVSQVLLETNACTFWGGALVVGTIIPAICGIVAYATKKAPLPLAIASGVCVFAGSICFRAVFYLLGFSVFGIF